MEGEEGNLVVTVVVVELEVVVAVLRRLLALLLQSRSDGPTGDKWWKGKEFARAEIQCGASPCSVSFLPDAHSTIGPQYQCKSQWSMFRTVNKTS